MRRGLPIVLSLGMASLCAQVAHASEPFTPEQLKIIEKMLQDQRVQVRKEILDELAKADKKPGEPALPAKTPAEPPILEESEHMAVGCGDPLPAGGVDVTQPGLSGDIVAVPLDRGTRGGISGLELETNGDTSEARATLAHTRNCTRNGRSEDLSWSITATAPIDDKDNKRSNFATLDGLSNGVGLKLAITHASTRQIVMGGETPSAQWTNLCKLAGMDGPNRCTLGKIHAAMSKPEADELRTAYQAFADEQYGWGTIWEGRIGASRKKYEYLSPALGKLDDTKVGWSVGGTLAFSTPQRRALYALGFDIQRTYKEKDAQVFCPAPTEPFTVCKQGRLGEPAQKYKRLLWVEARTDLLKVPFALRVTRDLEADETGVDLPIYLFRAQDKPFAGGVRWGWTSEKGSDFGIFVSSAFDVFK